MTDEKEPKEDAKTPEDAAPAEASKADVPASADAEAKAKSVPPAAEAKAKSVPPAAEAKAKSVPPAAEAKAKSDPPPAQAKSNPPPAEDALEHAAPRSHRPATSATEAEDAGIRMPTPGVRVRLAYAKGTGEVTAPPDPKSGLRARRILAEYDTTADVLHAAETLRDAGYKAFDAHSPFPVHGMDTAMGLPDSRLGWIVLCCGLTGVSSAWLMMFWMNGVDYPLIIGGKPPGTLPSMVPIMFELTVLLSAFGSVLGMFGLNRLPQHHDLLFYSDRFAAFSNDKFFLSVENQDPKFDVKKTGELLEKTHPVTIEVIETLEEVET